jgi:hypothetical protein
MTAQVLDGPPGATTRRLSSFLQIPVGQHRQGFAFADLSGLQEALAGVAGDATVGQQIEVPISRLDQGQPHQFSAFDAGHVYRSFESRARRRRPGYLQHRALKFPKTSSANRPVRESSRLCPILDIIEMALRQA